MEGNHRRRFTDSLERRAREVASWRDDPGWTSPVGTIRREIKLVLEQLQNQRLSRRQQRDELLQIETYVDTELMKMEDRIRRSDNPSSYQQDRLQRRLFELDKERRKVEASYTDGMSALQEKLLDLINKHELLSG